MRKRIRSKKQRKIRIGIVFIIVFILIAIYLWDFEINIKSSEQLRGAKNLSDLAVQGATIVENKIKGATDVLSAIAKALEDEEDIQSKEVMEYLQEMVSERNMDIIRMGITDRSGNAKTTAGKDLNVWEKTFFQESIKGKVHVSPVVSRSSEKGSIAVSVPLRDQTGKVRGVLYGIIETKDFYLYTSTRWDVDEEEQYIHIIDDKGNYISHSRNKNSLLYGDNLYEGMENANTTVSVDKIKESLAKGREVQAQIHKGKDTRYVYFAPMDINNWCVVTVLTGKVIDRQIGFSQETVMHLILKLFITFIALGGFYYKSISKEMREIEALNGELDIKDKIFQIAISEIGNFVFSYDLATQVLEFMNYDAERLPLPKRIEDFPNNFSKYVEEESKESSEIRRFLSEIDQGKTEIEGELSIGDEKNLTYYRVQVTSVMDNRNQIVRMIGTLKDITEEKEKELRIKRGDQIRSAVISDAIGFFEVDLNKDCLVKDGELEKVDYTYTQNLKWFAENKVSELYREQVKETFSIDNLKRMYLLGVYDVGLEYLRTDNNDGEYWVQCEAHLEKDVVTGDIIAVALVRNINAKKESELELKKIAILDHLTKAYNRRAGMEKINQILRENPQGNHAFLLLDLDNFKTVNDNLGHLVGDTVLMDVVNILKHHVWPEDVVCRLGGDEFVVFLVDMPEEAIGRSITKLLQKLNLTYEKNGIREEISASIGIALTPKDGTDFKTLYEKADIALYEVKNTSKNNYGFYKEN